MELRQYAALLRKWLWLIVVCTLAAGGTAYAVSRNSAPIYQATATLMVSQMSNPTPTGAGYSDILTSERLTRTYADLLTSRPVLKEAARRLGLEPADIAAAVDVTPIRDTQLLKITVEGINPQIITQVANTVSEVFIEQNEELQLGRISESRASLENEIAKVNADLARTQTALQAAQDDAERIRLEASLAEYRSTYSYLVSTYQQLKVLEVQAVDSVVIVEPADVPQIPVRPRTSTNTLLAAVVGAMLAVGVAFLVEYLDDTIKTPDDVSRVSGLSTLGAIARSREAAEGPGRQLIARLHSKAPEAEAYRTLRTNIQFCSVDKPVRTLLVTSAMPTEGKSTTAANLAVVMAQTGQRVVLVDTDLRRPVMHKVFGVPNNTGLTTALLAGEKVSLDGQLQPTEVENLSLLTSGPIPPNPSELLGSQRMAHLVEQLSDEADLVIFDSPPVLAVTDAAVLGRQVDGVLLVVDAGETREPALAQATAELQKTGATVLGAALNRLDTRRGGYYYYYYYYYADEEGQRKRAAARDGGQERARWPWRRTAVANVARSETGHS
jgi:non-specific protein-tyrosine kinase